MEVLNYIVYGDVTVADILVFTAVVVLAVIFARIVRLNLKKTLSDKMPRNELDILLKVVYYGIITTAVIAVLPHLGVNLSGLLVAGGIVGLVIGFASQSVVSNLVSGLFVMIERPIKIGDQVNIDGVSGFVEDIHVISTVVRTYDGVYVRIPNEKVFTSNITNYVANVARRFEYVVGIRYADDAEKAIEIIRRVIDEHPFALRNPPPQVFVNELAESSVNIVVRVWAPSAVWFDVKTELLWRIKTALEAEGIEIPFPQRVIWFANAGGGVDVESGKDVPAREDG
ncbi:mechanosensitive ion channel family protein [Archaeoglobus veneficus]|uniref:MscS Mechanosensitive ion channel n=1 Tax=Archaeoglobus veneficus (strain DSM 11195 / SNP6) TaxID=693661 RepID=F2KTC1_ARCVS|nr:mechanosensitive ion channel family protein [Archaeoglobus veneficus]AEA47151.1 MscS Mechanosensitive ion channel [Archaeoglobus veneficus SNP6]